MGSKRDAAVANTRSPSMAPSSCVVFRGGRTQKQHIVWSHLISSHHIYLYASLALFSFPWTSCAVMTACVMTDPVHGSMWPYVCNMHVEASYIDLLSLTKMNDAILH